MEKLKQFDLFAGYGGFTIAGERCGFETVGFSEIDKFANSVLKYNYPKIKNYGDIKEIKAEELPDFDLLTFGFPCQTFSIAGKRKGFEDLRGQLIYEVIRILKEKKPKYFIGENVKGLLSHNDGQTLEIILEELCESGYAIDFDVLNAKNFSVPQSRERLFIIGKRIDILRDDKII
jgi:DNA (cytosine-5)-methyltransferase 1